jgi:chemotaxis protein MotB
MRLILTALIFCLVAGSFQSCVSKKKYDELVSAKEATDQALAETQSNLKTLQEEKDALQSEFDSETARLNGEMSSLRNDMNAQMAQINEKLSMTESELAALKKDINDMFSSYEASGLSVETRDGDLYIVTENPVTFRSSSSRLTREERDAIDALGMKMKDSGIRVVVEGHADNKQFVAGSGRDNWDLSYARAKAVATRLLKAGVKPEQIVVAGRGDSAPAADNSTAEGRAQNRRTVVKPNPKLGSLMKKGN